MVALPANAARPGSYVTATVSSVSVWRTSDSTKSSWVGSSSSKPYRKSGRPSHASRAAFKAKWVRPSASTASSASRRAW